jgi:hypothetical protein
MAISPATLAKLARNDPDVVGLSLTLEVQSDADVILLVNALKGNTCFKSLTIQGFLDKSGISDKGARLLSSCRNLVYLDLSYNKNITDEGAKAFADHPSLETLFFRGCSVTPAGLYPFLPNDLLIDLRIAASASPEEAEGEAIKAKLKENKIFWLYRHKLKYFTAKEINDELYRFIQENSEVIEKLPKPLQIDAKKNPTEWGDVITTGLILSNNLEKLKGPEVRTVVRFSAIFAERYRVLREKQQRMNLMQFPPAYSVEQNKRAKTDEDIDDHEYEISPDI